MLKKRITAKQLAEMLLKLPPEQQEMEIEWADFSWTYPEDLQIKINPDLKDMLIIYEGSG